MVQPAPPKGGACGYRGASRIRREQHPVTVPIRRVMSGKLAASPAVVWLRKVNLSTGECKHSLRGCFRKASPRRGRGTVAPATVEGGLPQNCPTIFCKWLRKLYCLCTKSSLARGTPSVFGYASASSPIRWSLPCEGHPLSLNLRFSQLPHPGEPFHTLYSPLTLPQTAPLSPSLSRTRTLLLWVRGRRQYAAFRGRTRDSWPLPSQPRRFR